MYTQQPFAVKKKTKTKQEAQGQHRSPEEQ